MKSLLPILFVLMGALPAAAQTNIVPGYYVTWSGDTVKGHIDYRDDLQNGRECIFVPAGSRNAIHLPPESIAGYVVDNVEVYQSRKAYLSDGRPISGFFRTCISGKVELLQCGAYFFVRTDADSLVDISKRNIVKEGKSHVDPKGMGMLHYLMNDCDMISEAFLEKQYSHSPNFYEIFRRYYICTGRAYTIEPRVNIETKADYGVVAAGLATNMTFNSDELQGISSGYVSAFSLGACASIFVPKLKDNLRLVIELSLTHFHYYENFLYATQVNDFLINYNYVDLPILLRYSFHGVFAEAGLENELMAYERDQWRVETIVNSTVNTKDIPFIPFQGLNTGYAAGIGFAPLHGKCTLLTSIRYTRINEKKQPYAPQIQNLQGRLCLLIR